MKETPVSGALRAWLLVEVLFGLAAILAVFVFPEQTEINFAWPVKPPVMAATLGAFYLATGAVLVAALFVPTWERLRVIILPGAVFTALELAVTFRHWDRFVTGGLPFAVWFASYALPPPILAALYYWQQRRALPPGTAIDAPLPRWFRALCGANGLILVALFTLLLAVPELLIASGPWMFTPLTTRAFSAFGISLGLTLLSIVAENDWLRARLGTLLPIVLGPALLVQLGRFSAGVRWDNPLLLLFLADVLLLGGAALALWLRALGAGRR